VDLFVVKFLTGLVQARSIFGVPGAEPLAKSNRERWNVCTGVIFGPTQLSRNIRAVNISCGAALHVSFRSQEMTIMLHSLLSDLPIVLSRGSGVPFANGFSIEHLHL
jgi:hypothetical protein